MTTIETLSNGESWLIHRTKINDNFTNVNNDKVETSAYTDANVKTKYENNADTNAFTDAEKSKLSSLSVGGVDSINGQSWTVVLNQDDILDWTTFKQYSNTEKTKLAWIAAWAQPNAVASVNGQTGTVVVSKSDVGLWNVDNTSDADKPVSTATQTAINWKENSFSKNTAFNKNFWTVAWTVAEWSVLGNKQDALGYSPLEDVIAWTNITIDKTNPLNPVISASWGGGWWAVDSVYWRTGVVVAQNWDYTKAQVWLGNVDNTSDANKPVSTATQTELDTKLDSVVAWTNVTIDNTDPNNPVINASWGGGGWAVDSVYGRTGVVVAQSWDYTTTQVTEGTNLYYTEARVSANTNVVANTAKVSADGSVTTHNDITSAWSGAIITSAERTKLNGIATGAEVNNIASVNGNVGTVVLDTSDISDTTDARYITDAQQTVLWNTSGTNTGDQDLSGYVESDTTWVTGADQVNNIISLTQAEYDAITPDSATIYNITDSTPSLDFVDTTSNETVWGIKTFTDSPIIPAPTTDLQPATKKYVDDNAWGWASYAMIQKVSNWINSRSTNQPVLLDTITYDPDSIVTLSSNQFTLIEWIYIVSGSYLTYDSAQDWGILYNISDSVVEYYGTVAYSDPSDPGISTSSMAWQLIVPSGWKTYELRSGQWRSTYNPTVPSGDNLQFIKIT